MSKRATVLALVAIATLLAQQPALPADARIITFRDALQIALERNSALRQVENAARASEVNVGQARGQFYPDLAFSSRGTQSPCRSICRS